MGNISALADTAAKKASESAARSTGWGWHFIIVALLVFILLLQLDFLRRIYERDGK
ncbi:hypothetical protein D3C76_1719110 [compost metagenome]